jgi:nitrate/nitrite transporter NarK
VAESEARVDLLVRRRRGPRRDLLHSAVLRVVLSPSHSESESETSNIIVALALLLGMPFFTLFGALSDRIGRKWLMMAACLLSIVSYIPIYKQNASGRRKQYCHRAIDNQ